MNNSITAIILSHFKEREGNLKRIVDDLLAGTVVPNEIVIFIDNPDIVYKDDRATIIRSSKNFLPKIRFALGTYFDTEYCFFIDDDLTVRSKTLENFLDHCESDSILGLEGSILGKGDKPYSNDRSINRGNEEIEVDIIIRTYFVPTKLLVGGLKLQALHPDLPKKSLDDVYLCLGNNYLNEEANIVIPVDKDSDLTELDEGGVRQSGSGEHYENRNKVCRFLMDTYS